MNTYNVCNPVTLRRQPISMSSVETAETCVLQAICKAAQGKELQTVQAFSHMRGIAKFVGIIWLQGRGNANATGNKRAQLAIIIMYMYRILELATCTALVHKKGFKSLWTPAAIVALLGFCCSIYQKLLEEAGGGAPSMVTTKVCIYKQLSMTSGD